MATPTLLSVSMNLPILGLPRWCSGKESSCNAGDAGDRGLSLDQEDPLEEDLQTTPVCLPRQSHGLKSLAGYSPWGHKESDMTEHARTYSGYFI